MKNPFAGFFQQELASPVPPGKNPEEVMHSMGFADSPKVMTPQLIRDKYAAQPNAQVTPEEWGILHGKPAVDPNLPSQHTAPDVFFQKHKATPYVSKIVETSKKYNIPPSVLTAALMRESGNFNPKYVSGYHMDGTGRGVAGIDKNGHPEIKDEQAFDPNFSIEFMAKQLNKLTEKHGSVYDALRAYNGGSAYNSPRIGFAGKSVAENTKKHADTIFEMAKKLE